MISPCFIAWHILYWVIKMKKIIFRSMSSALRASDLLKSHGIISRPVRGGSPKCGCCIELVIYKGAVNEVLKVLKSHSFNFEMSE